MSNPIQPGTKAHPTGQALNIGLAFAENKRLWRNPARRIGKVVDSIPSIRVITDEATPKVAKKDKRTVMLTNHMRDSRYIWANSKFDLNQEIVNNEISLFNNGVRYEYMLDSQMMDRTMNIVDQILTDDILSGSDFWTKRFWLADYVDSASVDGVTDSVDSAIRITKGSEAQQALEFTTAQSQLQSPAYQDRLRMANGRVFESMKGLTAEMKSQLRVTLTEGVARGVGVRDLKGMINKRLSVGLVRAERIARTEINNVYRNAYMDEARELNETSLKDTQWVIRQMHRSALSPTTRYLHAKRHGSIHTMIEQKDWWAEDGNSINCQCSTLDVLVNKATGKVLQSKLHDTMLKQREEFTA